MIGSPRPLQDISQLPKPHHLRELSQYADGTDKEFLLRMSSDAGHVCLA
jgi:hypothetical protein